jgi:hypothetical protein
MNSFIFAGIMAAVCSFQVACKPRSYNQSKTKDLLGAPDGASTLCGMVPPSFESAGTESKARVRVACPGQCNGVDYRNRKFYLLNEDIVAGFEFMVTLNTGREIRNLFVFEPSVGIGSALKDLSLENETVQKSLQQYGIDSASITALTVPADGKILLLSGTKASLSQAGLLDGGSLDCGGQPIEGSVDLTEFKNQNLLDVRNSTTSPK